MKKFLNNEDGLVTIEWVGIAAVMVLAAVAITTFVMKGADTAGQGVVKGVVQAGKTAGEVLPPGAFGGQGGPAPAGP